MVLIEHKYSLKEVIKSLLMLLEKGRDYTQIYFYISQNYNIDNFELQLLVSFLEKEKVIKTCYFLSKTEPYVLYAASCIFPDQVKWEDLDNFSENLSKKYKNFKNTKTEFDNNLLREIIDILKEKPLSYLEIKKKIEQNLGQEIDNFKLDLHLIHLQKHKKIQRDFYCEYSNGNLVEEYKLI